MVIFIVEEGSIWNERNPILEKYADSVVVVCLYGKAVTDKYRCIVSPKRQVRLGMDAYGTEGFLFGAISLAKEELKACISHEKDIVFLTDNEPRSLYPYILLKNECEGKRVHLWCISPLRFESKFRIKSYYKMLQSIDVITSLLFLNFNDFLYTMDRRSTLLDLFEYCSDYLNELLPNALHEINNLMKPDEKYFYDFTYRRYISTKNNYMDMLKDDDIYKEYTGESNKKVIENLRKLLDVIAEEKICLRLPVIPNYKSVEDRTQELSWIYNNISKTINVDCFDYMKQ